MCVSLRSPECEEAILLKPVTFRSDTAISYSLGVGPIWFLWPHKYWATFTAGINLWREHCGFTPGGDCVRQNWVHWNTLLQGSSTVFVEIISHDATIHSCIWWQVWKVMNQVNCIFNWGGEGPNVYVIHRNHSERNTPLWKKLHHYTTRRRQELCKLICPARL